jgi:hypothetical protein
MVGKCDAAIQRKAKERAGRQTRKHCGPMMGGRRNRLEDIFVSTDAGRPVLIWAGQATADLVRERHTSESIVFHAIGRSVFQFHERLNATGKLANEM